MTRHCTLTAVPPESPADDVLRALARALAPHLRALAAATDQGGALVDVLTEVPAPPRAVMRACRDGRIAGAVRVGRRWLAPRVAVQAWLRTLGPRLVAPAETSGDDLEGVRAALARPSRRRVHRCPSVSGQSRESMAARAATVGAR